MAMRTAYLVGLLALGLFMLVTGWPWWLGVGVILTAMALSVGGETQPTQAMAMPAATAPAAKAPAAETNWLGWDMDDMKWSPTTFADGMPGNKMDGEFGGAVGSRSSAFTQDMGPIRFKDDFRFRISDGDFYKMCTDPYTGKALTAWDFRTRKDVFPGLHTGTVKTVESPDDMTNPGLGSPNEWFAASKKQKK